MAVSLAKMIVPSLVSGFLLLPFDLARLEAINTSYWFLKDVRGEKKKGQKLVDRLYSNHLLGW